MSTDWDPFGWVIRPDGKARHLQTCQHFTAVSRPKTATAEEVARLPVCVSCRDYHARHLDQTTGELVAVLGALDWMVTSPA